MNPVTYVDPSGYAGKSGSYDFVGPVSQKELSDYYSSVRAYDGVDISQIPYEYRIEPNTIIEMEYKGYNRVYGVNSEGWERNATKYFKQLQKAHPEYFDASNTNIILSGGTPTINEQFVEHFPQYEPYNGDEMRHHHVGGAVKQEYYLNHSILVLEEFIIMKKGLVLLEMIV